MMRRLHEEGENDDPLLSVINLIDVFLVLIAALLLSIAENPLQPFSQENITVIRHAGESNMEIITRHGDRIERFRGDGQSAPANSQAEGVRAGTAYRLPDGSLIYIPD